MACPRPGRIELSKVATPPKVRFDNGGSFIQETRLEVDAYLAGAKVNRRGRFALYRKAPIAIGLMIAAWSVLIFANPGLIAGILALGVLAFGAMLTAFSVQHDANHGAYFGRRRYDHLVGWTSDALLGYSSYVWRVKHNVAHHTYTNVAGYDDDIEQQPWIRLVPAQGRRSWYRLQFIYIWGLYCMFTMRMQFVGDYLALAKGQVGQSTIRRPRGWTLVGYVGGKLIFLAWTIAIPLLVYPWWVVLVAIVGVSCVTGVVVAVTFQLAHCVEEASFTTPEALAVERRIWAVHEIESTVDFCPRNWFLTWFLGGLNYQIEHHLFPRVPHVHYPHIAAIVRRKAAEHGVRYTVHETLRGALRSHVRHLREMGRKGMPVEMEMG
jgi:linoleoyl-CoA desaturase